ncbi:MAG: mandelate racemase/muconate lactonizing enzyme family protein [Candidatus Binatia bacterium]
MKIDKLDFIPHRLKRRGRWQTASYTADYVDVFYVKIHTDDGVNGIGAGSVIPNARGEPFGAGLEAVKGATSELFIGKDPRQIAPLFASLHRAVPGFTRHKAGIELGLFDLLGKAYNVSLSTLLGGGTRETIPALKMLSMGSAAEMAETAAACVQQGYCNLKVKLGTGAADNLERFKAVRSAVTPDVTLTVDSNGAYDAGTATNVIAALEPLGLTMVEQPVKGTDLKGMAEVKQAVRTAVLADQEVQTAADVFQIARDQIADAVSIKLLKFGGLQESVAAARVCEAAGLVCHVGGTASSRLVDAAQVYFVSAMANVVMPSEVAEFTALEGDLIEGLEVVNGAVRVPTGPGLGVRLTA